MRTTIAIVCALFFLTLCQPQAKADTCSSGSNLVSNCGFESGDFTGWTLAGNDVPDQQDNLYGVEGTDPFPLPDGTAPNSGAFQAFFADQFGDPTTLSQTLTTVVGQEYTVTFYLAQELVGPGVVNNSFSASLGGATLAGLTNVDVQGYTVYSTKVDATATSSTLSFTFGNDIGEFLIDDASVTATPEPGTLPVLAAGFLGAVWFYRRRTSRSVR